MLRALAPLALAAAVAGGAGSAAAVVAPPGSAAATGLEVTPLDSCVSCTTASAGPEGTTARATALRLLGRDLVGGSSRGGSSARGALVALPGNPALDIALASWETGTETGGPPASQSRSALVDLGVLPSGEDSTTGGLVTVAVLETFADATHSGSRSGGYGAANGADIGLANGTLVIIVLHSQATGDEHGGADVASVGGAQVLGGAGDSPGIPATVPGVLEVTLLRSGAGGGVGSAAVGSVDRLLDFPGQVAGILTAAGRSGAAAGAAGAGTPATGTGEAAAGPPPARSPGIPSTGAAAGGAGLVALGAGALAGVAALRGRRRTA